MRNFFVPTLPSYPQRTNTRRIITCNAVSSQQQPSRATVLLSAPAKWSLSICMVCIRKSNMSFDYCLYLLHLDSTVSTTPGAPGQRQQQETTCIIACIHHRAAFTRWIIPRPHTNLSAHLFNFEYNFPMAPCSFQQTRLQHDLSGWQRRDGETHVENKCPSIYKRQRATFVLLYKVVTMPWAL